jgi:hypothetical protein
LSPLLGSALSDADRRCKVDDDLAEIIKLSQLNANATTVPIRNRCVATEQPRQAQTTVPSGAARVRAMARISLNSLAGDDGVALQAISRLSKIRRLP